MSLIPHCEVCDFARLTILVYEYGKSFTIDEDKTIEGFVSELNEDKPLIENEFRLNIIKELSQTSPHGKVYKFYRSFDNFINCAFVYSWCFICFVYSWWLYKFIYRNRVINFNRLSLKTWDFNNAIC